MLFLHNILKVTEFCRRIIAMRSLVAVGGDLDFTKHGGRAGKVDDVVWKRLRDGDLLFIESTSVATDFRRGRRFMLCRIDDSFFLCSRLIATELCRGWKLWKLCMIGDFWSLRSSLIATELCRGRTMAMTILVGGGSVLDVAKRGVLTVEEV